MNWQLRHDRAIFKMKMATKPLLALIDGSSYIFRAFYAIPRLSNSRGMPTNASLGFTKMLKKVVRELRPSHLAVVFDPKGGSFRNEMYPEYKANRREMPEDLPPQIPDIKKIVDAFNIANIEVKGYEADDVIGALVEKYKSDFDIIIVTSDKDMTQLVDLNVTLLDTMKDKTTGVEEVRERYGVEPGRVVEVLGLSGDTSDNVPGVPGIGGKTAKSLIEQFGDIEGVLDNIDNISGKKRKENLAKFADQARLSKQLVTIKTDVPIKQGLDEIKARPPNNDELRRIYAELELSGLLEDLETTTGEKPREALDYRMVTNEKDLMELVAQLEKADWFAFDAETTSKDPHRAELVGISVCAKKGVARYIPLRHRHLGAPPQLPVKTVLEALRPPLQNPEKSKTAHNAKRNIIVLAQHGVRVQGAEFDAMIANYVLNPSMRQHSLKMLAQKHLGRAVKSYSEIAGKGAKMVAFDQVDVDTATRYACDAVEVAFELKTFFQKTMDKKAMELMRELEMPLVCVLAAMERNGVKVDPKRLKEISDDLFARLKSLENQIHKTAGGEFNPASPRQLAEVLFDKIGLPVIKKTKTGRSSDADVLKELALQHPLPSLVLDYRGIAKLRGTYTEALPRLINKKTGRIHTSFNQTATSTGRLSSSEPNLQNIPVRSGAGRSIREAFVPEKGKLLVSADYSQIELRILAHLSGDDTLLESFRNGEDVHTRVAAQLFDVNIDEVDYDQRRKAKVVNFGIAYGMSAYGLSKELRIPHYEAQGIIDAYFDRYPKVRVWMDKNVDFCRKNGFVTTIRGRKLYLPDINAKNRNVRLFNERAAINAPMQGSAADIIKKAMLDIHHWLNEKAPDAIMILQVHDELLFETPEKGVKKVEKVVREKMESVAQLKVPLTVDVNHGLNWAEAH